MNLINERLQDTIYFIIRYNIHYKKIKLKNRTRRFDILNVNQSFVRHALVNKRIDRLLKLDVTNDAIISTHFGVIFKLTN